MKGSVKWQVIEIFKEIKQIGSSKHEAKNTARQDGAHGSHGIAQKTGLYGINTIDSYRNSVEKFGTWAKENAGLKDLTKTVPEAVKAYLSSRIAENVAHKTFQAEKAALNKFESALNKYSQTHNLNKTYDFKLNETFKNDHKSLRRADVRAYSAKVVEKLLSIKNPAVNLAVRLALNAGLRKSEILKLSEKNILGDKIDVIGAKGGKDRIVSKIHDRSLISDVKAFLKENNIQKLGDAMSGAKINNEIRAVLKDTGAIHPLRHNYSISTIKDFEKEGYSNIQAEYFTSGQLGHERVEIVENIYSK